MTLRKFKIEDMQGEWLEGEIGAVSEDVLANCVSATVVDDGEIVACGGILMAEEPIFWMGVKKNIQKPIALIKTIKRFISIAMDDLKIDRAVAFIRDGFTQAEKLDRILGFKSTDRQETINNKLYNRYEIWRGYQ